MKVIKFPSSDENKVIDFFNNIWKETIQLKHLKHEYIIEFVDAYFSQKNEIFIVTEFAEGGSLYDLHNSGGLEYL